MFPISRRHFIKSVPEVFIYFLVAETIYGSLIKSIVRVSGVQPSFYRKLDLFCSLIQNETHRKVPPGVGVENFEWASYQTCDVQLGFKV